jgi:hypothetical protein
MQKTSNSQHPHDHFCLLTPGTRHLASALRVNRSLTALKLDYNGIGTPGLTAILIDALPLNRGALRELSIGGHAFGWTGATAVARFLSAALTPPALPAAVASSGSVSSAGTSLSASLPSASAKSATGAAGHSANKRSGSGFNHALLPEISAAAAFFTLDLRYAFRDERGTKK